MTRKMTRKTSHFLYILLATLLLCLVAVPADAKKKNPKKQQSTDAPFTEPDPLTQKARPDSHLRAIEMPSLMGGSTAGYGYHHRTGGVPHMQGIDVSHYQGNIDWASVARNRNIQYVYIKCSEGGNNLDDCYLSNIREARRHGLKVGSYHFFRANVSAQVQLENMMSVMNTKHQDLLPIIDVELTNGVGEATFHSRLKEFLRLVERRIGRKPMIYTGKNFYNKHFAGQGYGAYKFMIAAYSGGEPELFNNADYVIWQYSSQGTVRGIRGNVDLSMFVGRHGIRDILW